MDIADPRRPEESSSERVTTRRCALGRHPYATPDLDPAALEEALQRIFTAARPSGASPTAWGRLAGAAAMTLAGIRGGQPA